MMLIIRSTLFALFVISSFMILATEPVRTFIESTPYLSSWPRATLFLYAAVAGIISNAKASLLLPIRNPYGTRSLPQLSAIIVAIIVLVVLRGNVLQPPVTVYPVNLNYSWPFIVTGVFSFIVYWVVSLFSVQVGKRTTPDDIQFRLTQRWIAKPLMPFRLVSLIATDESLIVIRPKLLTVSKHEISYVHITRVLTEGWRFFVCTVHIESLRGDHIAINMMPRKRAEIFARAVLRQVDSVTRATASARVQLATLDESEREPVHPKIEADRYETNGQFDRNDATNERDFKQERMRHTRLQNKGKRQ